MSGPALAGIYHLQPPTELWRRWGVFDELREVFADTGYSAANTTLMDLYLMADEAR